MTSVFICPVCREPLSREEKRYVCPGNHSFDVSASGHVNLLLSNRRHSPNPGDDREMMRARGAFLQKGYFRILADELSRLVVSALPDGGVLLDSGCGEGYYAAAVAEAFRGRGGALRLGGIDVAKHGVQAAARKTPDGEFAVASAYELPLADGSVDALWSCFAPTPLEEFHRVVKAGGIVIVVQPAARHLWGFKSVLYDSPRENPPNEHAHPGFEPARRHEVVGTVRIDAGDLPDLFRMTPYFWKTSVEDGKKLETAGDVETEIGFIVDVLRKKKD